jgi:hypothetical protein
MSRRSSNRDPVSAVWEVASKNNIQSPIRNLYPKYRKLINGIFVYISVTLLRYLLIWRHMKDRRYNYLMHSFKLQSILLRFRMKLRGFVGMGVIRFMLTVNHSFLSWKLFRKKVLKSISCIENGLRISKVYRF